MCAMQHAWRCAWDLGAVAFGAPSVLILLYSVLLGAGSQTLGVLAVLVFVFSRRVQH